MVLLIIFCIVFMSVSSATENLAVFRKCCPKGQSLLKVVVPESNESYKCIDGATETSLYNVSYPSLPLIVTGGFPVEYGMPENCELQMNILSEKDIQFSKKYCYERLVIELINGSVQQNIPKTISLQCDEIDLTTIKSDLKVENIRKCCPKGKDFDTEYHICRDTTKVYDDDWYINILEANAGNVYEVDKDLYCKKDEYAVELKEKDFLLSLRGSTLHVLKKNGKGGGSLLQGNWCVDREYASEELVARVCTRDCSSYGAFCMRKCCPVGEHYSPNQCGRPASVCVPNTDDGVLYNISTYINPLRHEHDIGDTMGLRAGIVCAEWKIVLNSSYEPDRHWLTPEGWLHSSFGITNDYCIETFDTRSCRNKTTVNTVKCFIKPPKIKDFYVSFVLNSISAVCLAFTLVVYISIPELRNLHGRNVICHVSTMLLAYSCLARVQYNHVSDDNLCTALGYAIFFGFVAAFAWLNVMCFDIWWTFGSVRTVQPLHKGGAGRRRFRLYSLYAWGTSLTLTLTLYLFDRFPVSPILDAEIGNAVCWFSSVQNSNTDWPHYIFFVIPMGVVTCTNFVLWALTARHCARVKSEVHRLQAGSVGDRAKKRFRMDKANMVLTGKLWVIMGAGWISELVSTIAADHPHWTLSAIDKINELQGVFIFITLIFKPKLYYLFRKRLGYNLTFGLRISMTSCLGRPNCYECLYKCRFLQVAQGSRLIQGWRNEMHRRMGLRQLLELRPRFCPAPSAPTTAPTKGSQYPMTPLKSHKCHNFQLINLFLTSLFTSLPQCSKLPQYLAECNLKGDSTKNIKK